MLLLKQLLLQRTAAVDERVEIKRALKREHERAEDCTTSADCMVGHAHHDGKIFTVEFDTEYGEASVSLEGIFVLRLATLMHP